jgi:ribonuclease VapC
MFVDASALVALLSGEREAARVSTALETAQKPVTSAVAVLETALALARPDKLDLPLDKAERLVRDFLAARGIALCDLPPAADTARLALYAVSNYSNGRHGLNICDCLHYACAKHENIPILATDGEFGETDLRTID